MQGELGEKLGEGSMSDVHAWAPGLVVKLYRPHVPRRIPWWEAQMTRAVFAAGGPASEVWAEVKVDGRHGLVLTRLDGPTLLQAMDAGQLTLEAGGEILATLGRAVHATPPPEETVALYPYMEGSLPLPDARLPAHIGEAALAAIARLPPEDALCHCDLHPSNVIVTADGPRLIDWTGTRRGGIGYDLACGHFLRTELLHESLGPPDRQRAFHAAFLAAYAQGSGRPLGALMTTIEEHLPIVRAFFLLSGGDAIRPATRARLLQRLEADFGLAT